MPSECGLGPCCRPSWLGRFATSRWFLVIYGLLGTTQTMAFIYFVATLTTLEKRFKIPSKTTGIVMSGNEISQIMLSLFLSYYGGRGNRPLWISCGVAFSAISCFILAMPHYIYGAGQDALALTEEYLDASRLKNGSVTEDSAALCSSEVAVEVCSEEEYSMAPVIIIFMSQFVLGIGTTLYFALGQTYLDDNTKKTRAPMLLGMVMALRSVGPAIGFVLGFACLSFYIDPTLTPVIDKKDPRWLGAWWLGWIILGCTMLLFSVLIAMFPRHLPKKPEKTAKTPIVRNSNLATQSQLGSVQSKEEQPLTQYIVDEFIAETARVTHGELEYQERKTELKKSDFRKALMRLLKNKLLMFNNISSVFYILGASGYFTFLTKYMETQFQKSAAGANVFAGTFGILAMVAGFLVSGIVISKLRPSPRKLLGWNVIIGFIYVLGEISFIFIGCPDNGVQGTVMPNGSLSLGSPCNEGCNCAHLKYTPVCYEEHAQTFYSACHAGCTTKLEMNVTQNYGNCSCLDYGSATTAPSQGSQLYKYITETVTSGPCFVDCGASFYWFIAITCLMHSLGSSGRIGNILVNYRSVLPEDKPFSQGLGLLMLSVFAFIPGPIIYGAIIDSTCLVWNESCGNRGNCWLYHKDDFRYYINITSACFTSLAVFFDILVWYFGKGLNLYDEHEEDKT